ncbi:tyrosine-type recombinase/integrase [Ruegeria sp. HKCCA4707]|uniref:tyrosine-type recombinase/integrase n=1 Tax=Ruegeria sp. HKCCA4707 TaxID=2682984 RepID=UPI001489FF5F|nr:tyrosine-type recombinase/integrase [Ruegeria sp. HKCCA4707]
MSSIQKVQRKTGPRWRVQTEFWDPVKKKRVRQTRVFKTHAEAKEFAVKYDAEYQDGVRKTRDTVTAFSEDWLQKRLDLGHIRENTYYAHKTRLDAWCAYFGHLPLSKLTTQNIEEFLVALTTGQASLSKKPLAAKTVSGVLALLRVCLRDACAQRLLSWNPAEAAKAPKAQPKPRVPMPTRDELRMYLDAIDDSKWRLPGRFQLYTGLRRSELFGLPEHLVDLQHGTIRIEQSLMRVAKDGRVYYKVAPVKAEASLRTLSLAPDAVEVLAEQIRINRENRLRAEPGTWDTEGLGLVFVDERGDAIRTDTYTQALADIRRGLELPAFQPTHVWRKVMGTEMVRAGVPINVVAEQLGHTPLTAQQHYIRPDSEDQRKAVSHVASLFNKK